MQEIKINKDTTIKWYNEYGFIALNTYNHCFEDVSELCADDKNVIVYDDDYINANEQELIEKIRHIENSGGKLVYTLYTNPYHKLVGFVYEQSS